MGKSMLSDIGRKERVDDSREYGAFGGFISSNGKHANAHSFPFKAKLSLWFHASGKLNHLFFLI